jgi:hypothetical protein
MAIDPIAIANRFVEWWANSSRFANFEQFFVERLSYSQSLDTAGQQMLVLKDDDALWHIRQYPPWSDLRTESKLIAPEVVQISGRGTDPITGLQYELNWRLIFKEGKIFQVDEVYKVVEDTISVTPNSGDLSE